MSVVIACVAGYLIGSIPFGLLVARWCGGIDIRQHGSGNIGATNVGRVMGFKWFVAVFLLDACKGLLPTGGALLWTLQEQQLAGSDPVSTLLPVLAGLSCVLGHMFPCWLGFRGGKGVATALGVVLVLAPWSSLVAAVLFGLSFAVWRTVSISSLLAAISFGVLQMFLLKPSPFAAGVWPIGLFSLLVPLLIVYRHRSNIVRLWRGEELAFHQHQPEPPGSSAESDEETPQPPPSEKA